MRIKANTMRFGAEMWANTNTTRSGIRWRKMAKMVANRRDRREGKKFLAE